MGIEVAETRPNFLRLSLAKNLKVKKEGNYIFLGQMIVPIDKVRKSFAKSLAG